MAINLKQISISDSDNIKLDKVNYNFDQLVANGGGPQGPQGPKGDMGFQGVMGPQGHQGAMGFQGDVGAPGPVTESYWTRVAGDNASLTTDTLFPEPNVGAQNPPVISIGFLSTDPEYGTHQNLSAGQSPYQWIINRKNHFFSNLRFKSGDVIDNWVDFILSYDQAAGKTTFRTQFKELGSAMPTRFIWSADNHIFRSNVTGQDILSINSNNANFTEEVHFDSKVTINTELYIENANADLDKIATSVDNTGLVTFKSIAELGGTVPYGTIISVLPDVFTDNTRFVNSQTINLNQLPNTIDDALKIRIGAGIGDYAGWYVCNGKVWIGDINQSQHLVPDLNSFSYTIAENPMSIDPNSQGTASETNGDINIIGGADIVMNATTPAAGIYGIGSNVDTTDVDINTTLGTTFKIKKLPQIIYLGETDLYWKDKGTGQAPATTLNFELVDANTGPNGLGTVSLGSATYTQGGSYLHQVYVNAPNGYYWSTSPAALTFPGYIDGITQTLSPGTYPTTIALNISVDIQPANGTTAIIGIDTTSLVTLIPNSTQIYPTQVSYPSLDAISNGYVYETYDLGTDPNSVGTLIPSGSVTAPTGSIRYIKYRLKADNYFYKWNSPSLSSFSFNSVAGIGAGQITEHSVTDVNGDGKTIDYIVKDNNFGVGNPGGSNQLYAFIQAGAGVYTDVVNSSGSGSPALSFNFNSSGSSSPLSLSGSGLIKVRSGVSVIVRLKVSSNTYISGGSGSVSVNGTNLSANFPYMTTTQAFAYSSNTAVPLDNTVLTFSGNPTINTGAGGTFGSASMELEYSNDGGSTWKSCGS
jgi:hypothetical protein